MTLPILSLQPDQLTQLTDAFDETFASLAKYFTLREATSDAEMESARTVANALSGTVHSSDTDCEYYPCTLTGPEPSSDAFFTALGVARDARASVSGWNNPKLEVTPAGKGEGERPAIALVTRLGSGELEELRRIRHRGGAGGHRQRHCEASGDWAAGGHSACTDDGFSKAVLVLARAKSGVHVGILTVRIET